MLVWDQIGTRRYETGVDRGVLYLSPWGPGIAWNGLLSVDEDFDHDVESIYYDGVKVNDFVVPGDFSASLTAYTYPEAFLDFEGIGMLNDGVHLSDQLPKPFCLSYRTMVGNDLDGTDANYKIHIVYNVTAVPSSREYESISDDTEAIEFEWDLTAVPTDISAFVTGFRPTAHVIFSSDTTDPLLLAEIEDLLYGINGGIPSLIPLDYLASFVDNYFRIRITDHNNGTWSAEDHHGEFVSMTDDDEFLIEEANATYSDADTFTISNSYQDS